jgi:hypothetical protein
MRRTPAEPTIRCVAELLSRSPLLSLLTAHPFSLSLLVVFLLQVELVRGILNNETRTLQRIEADSKAVTEDARRVARDASAVSGELQMRLRR